jgi:acetylornithine deacetylase/succinyl-diaminopimelate desuccinylase-like protein
MLDDALQTADLEQATAEELLLRELRIPSIGAQSEHRPDMAAMRDVLAEHLHRLGFTIRLSDPADGEEPILEAEWFGAPSTAPLVTVYGHYDVQPPGPREAWTSDPFDPVIRDGAVWARGAADNKGNHVAAMVAAEHCITAGSPVNFRFLFDGGEETWSPEFARYVAAETERLRTDVVLLWDNSFAADGRPLLVSAMRGIVSAEIRLTGAARDAHSGTYGGILPNPIHAAATIIAGLKTVDGLVDVPGFYDGVDPVDPAESADWDRSGDMAASLRSAFEIDRLHPPVGVDPIDAMWALPTLDCTGISSGYAGEGAMGVIPSKAIVKVGMRLVVGQDPERVFESFAERVQELAPEGVRVSVRMLGHAHPVRLSAHGGAADLLKAAFAAEFGVEPSALRIGGGMQPAHAAVAYLGGQVIASGANQPSPGAHAPDEHMNLRHFHLGARTLIRFFHALGTAR